MGFGAGVDGGDRGGVGANGVATDARSGTVGTGVIGGDATAEGAVGTGAMEIVVGVLSR